MQSQRVLTYTADAISASAILGTLAGLLPPLAAIAGLLWYIIQIYESKTVQRYVRARRLKQRRERITNGQ